MKEASIRPTTAAIITSDDEEEGEDRALTPLEAQSPSNNNDNDEKMMEVNTSWRNLVAFFICGLINNFGYVLLLTAAEDLIHGQTGIILLCDIIPSFIVKFTAPLYFHLVPYNVRVLCFVIFSIISFQTVAWSENIYLKMVGVVFSSMSSGGGEVTFLQMSSYYHKNVVSTWSSGTGAAGLVGAFTYLLFRSWIGLSPSHVMLISTVFPFLMLLSTFLLMTGNHARDGFFARGSGLAPKKVQLENPLTAIEKIKLIPGLVMKYMLPLAIVYYMEYLINTAIASNITFKTGLITSSNYVYYSNIYQIGVFVSRSSVNLFKINYLWIPAVLQTLNVVILFIDAYFRVIPAIWFIFMIIFYEGLLGGGIYVNCYYKMTTEIEPRYREYSISIVSNADSFGISLSGLTATFLQPWLRKHQSHRYI